MSGTVLIVDGLATNRIVLKAKLATTPYRIVQAASAEDGLRLLEREAPDLVIANTCLAGQTAEPFLRALRRDQRLSRVPVVMLQGVACAPERKAMLRAGADDVLARPLAEPLLLARLRNLMRKHHSEAELDLQTGDPGGFAEAQPGFDPPGRVSLFASSRAGALALRSQLEPVCPHRLTCIAPESPPPATGQDVVVLRIAMALAEDGLRRLADLKASPGTSHCPALVLLEPDAAPLAVTLLDMGADDVILAPADPEELGLRIDRQVARKRRNERLRRHLRSGLEAALRDPLTGVHNRRYALPWLDRQIAQARATGQGLAVMLADIDFFKSVNDRHGHAAGDAVLCAVTERLAAHLRSQELLARIGGEEFLIALPDTPRDRAERVADRLCEAIRATPVTVPGIARPIPVTLSIGVTVVAGTSGEPAQRMQHLIDEADRALYAAKAQGRNQASFCTRSAA